MRCAEHRGVAHENRRLDFLIAVLARMQIEHELFESAGKARERAFQHDEARAGELRRRIKVHQPELFAKLEMFERLVDPVERGRLAPTAHLDIVVLVLAVGHVLEGDVGDRGEFGVEPFARLALDSLEFRHGRLEACDLGLEVLGRLHILARHRSANLLGGGVTAFLDTLKVENRRAALLIQPDQIFRARRQTAARQPCVKG